MVPTYPLSRSTTSTTLGDSASTSYDTSIPSHLAIAAVLARSASTFASSLATSHPPTIVSLTQAAPTPQSTTAPPHTTSWYRAPNTRGTWQLLVTCLFKINLCVWTAVHLNITPKLDKRDPLRIWTNYYCARAKWLLLGLLAPEFVVYVAWMQWESARVFKNTVNSHRSSNIRTGAAMFRKSKNESNERIPTELALTSAELDNKRSRGKPLGDFAMPGESHEMTIKHGFYAGMGSYYIDLDVLDDPGPSQLYRSLMQDPNVSGKRRGSQRPERGYYWRSPEYLAMVKEFYASIRGRRSPKRLYLNAEGVLALVKAGKLSLPSEEAITDRSKSNILAKTLVCLQAGYMIVQCISRLASSLPLTFLEINTLGHVLCALIMYSFWFHKPQDLNLSTVLEADLTRQLGNWYRSCLNIGSMEGFCSLYKAIWERTKTTKSSQTSDPKDLPSASILKPAVPFLQPRVVEGYPKKSDVDRLNGNDYVLVLEVDNGGNGIHGIPAEVTKQIRSWNAWNIFTTVYLVDNQQKAFPIYTHKNPRVICCPVYWHDLQRFGDAVQQLLHSNTDPFDYRHWYFEELIWNWSFPGLLQSHTFLPPFAIAISTALYGSLHAAAWHSFFPTEVEKWFWRVSSTVIAASGLLFAYCMVANRLVDKIIDPFRYQSFARVIVQILSWVLVYTSTGTIMTLIFCLGIPYIAARLFLVVESFISLRKVPIEVYETPDWTQWIPHL